jgi:hypothetical protein
MTIKESAANVYDTLQALHNAVGDTPEMVAHHAALNELRQLFAPWIEFLAFIGREESARGEVTFGGGVDKDPPPPPGPK